MAKEEIYGRRSIRKFKEEMLPLEVSDEILDAGRVAPSGENKQPWKFLVYAGEKKAQMLAAMVAGTKRERKGAKEPDGGDAKLATFFSDRRYGAAVIATTLRVLQDAPVVVMVMNPNGKSPFETATAQERVDELIDTLSIGGAVENMILRAKELGLGTLWAGGTFWAYQELEQYLAQPGQLVCAVALGYADEEPAPRPRKELQEIVEYHID